MKLKYRIAMVYLDKVWRSKFIYNSVQECYSVINNGSIESIQSIWIEVLR